MLLIRKNFIRTGLKLVHLGNGMYKNNKKYAREFVIDTLFVIGSVVVWTIGIIFSELTFTTIVSVLFASDLTILEIAILYAFYLRNRGDL